MKEFITNAEFQRVLELLGLPGETLSIEIGGRARRDNDSTGMLMTGIASSWGMKAVIADGHELPYSTRTIYVPVLLPSDEERNETNGWCAPSEEARRGEQL